MYQNIKQAYLKQSYEDNWETYQRSLEGGSGTTKWDIFIITASNEEQAIAYRMQINQRVANGYLSTDTQYIVIPDPDGKRVGSGGATLNALYEAIIQAGLKGVNPFEGKRILMIHSGGDSKRIPQYSAFGKLFSRVPRELPDGRYSTLFDEFVISLSGVPARMAEGVLIASGDVLLLYNTNQMDLMRKGAVGVGIKVEAQMGTKHGVYLSDERGYVRKFLHKQPVDKLKAVGAVSETGNVNVDTGLMWMDSEVAYKMLSLILTDGQKDQDKYNTFINDTLRLNFYGDFLIPLTQEGTLEGYLKEEAEGEYCEELLEVRRKIWDALHGTPMFVQSLSPAQFIHFGTTAELRDLMKDLDHTYKFLSWSRDVVSVDNRHVKDTSISLVNSYVGTDVTVGEDCYIEDSRLEQGMKIGKGCVVSNVIAEKPFELREELVLHSLPVVNDSGRKGYITRIYGVKDNPKQDLKDGTFLNQPMSIFVEKADIEIATLWDAPIYPLCDTLQESIEYAIWMSNYTEATKEELEAWKRFERYSLKESYEIAHLEKVLETQQQIEDVVRIHAFLNGVHAHQWVEEILPLLGMHEEARNRRLDVLIDYCKKSESSLMRARLYRYLAEAKRKVGGKWRLLEDCAYEEINRLIQESAIVPTITADLDTSSYIDEQGNLKRVVVESPARVNFGGGWSDTPPYSMEHGGTVLNAAIYLKGKLPIKVIAEFIDEPVIRLTSKDLKISKDFNDLGVLIRCNDPTDPLALHKAAMVVTGILPQKVEEGLTLGDRLGSIGYGIHLYTEVDIPKGSGLGTSSIISGAVVKALHELLAIPYDYNKLFEEVLCLEQLLTTGGGWQDQVGGLVPGIKITTARPGLPQQLEVTELKLDEQTIQELDERLVVVFTGQRRLAKGILREIMGEYILGNPVKVEILNDIQKISLMMKYELEKGNINNFCELMNRHLELSKRLDKGSTNNYIDSIIEVCKPYASGMMICGAGGGGFLQLLLKDADCKKKLSTAFEEIFGDNQVEVWDAKLYFEK